MIFGEQARAARHLLTAFGLSLALLFLPQAAMAAAPNVGVTAVEAMADEAAGSEVGGEETQASGDEAQGSYVPMKPTEGKGMPIPGALGLQKQYSPLGEYASWIHDIVLLPIITVISLLVLGLLLFVIVRYNRRANPTASRTSHNTVIEVVWTLVPVLILVGIAVPSIDLLAKQYDPGPADALTIKATGNQWYWTYSYPDNGEFELVSNMLNVPGHPVINNGVRYVGEEEYDGPAQLEVDNRMVVPVGEPIRLQVTAADVIHSFAVPSLWFKIDAVPGRINEKILTIEEPGVYYGQCSELCGAKHGYMPIAIEALPRDKYNAWVLAQAGGVIDGQPEEETAPAAEEPAEPAPAEIESPAPAA